ncbi:MAG: hypothetical protein DRI86_10770 [Bacteroidetes bacterium]|nr:MAG: hypothetical protein DRI86_10770 [Bacteroidota bacterium]
MRFLLIFSFFFISFINNNANATNYENIPAFREVIWGITHPFIVLKVKRLTKRSMIVTDSLGKDKILFDKSGGNLDAFKHSYWMASLSQNIKEKKARKIGIIHEKVNYRQYKRALRKGKCVQDSTASLMDLKNNDVGILIGLENKKIQESELIKLVIFAVESGKLFIVSKDEKGNYLDCNGEIIINTECRWNKGRCLMKSGGR